MKIKIAPGRAVQLTGRQFSSVRGGVYDLAALGATKEDEDRLKALDGVEELTGKAPSKGMGGDS